MARGWRQMRHEQEIDHIPRHDGDERLHEIHYSGF